VVGRGNRVFKRSLSHRRELRFGTFPYTLIYLGLFPPFIPRRVMPVPKKEWTCDLLSKERVDFFFAI